MKNRKAARDAYVEAEVVTALAHQIRAIRLQRNWSQADLAKQMGTTQAAVSRLEDPSYGRMSIKTLIDLSKVFDTGLRVQFVSTITMLHETFKPKEHLREVPSFEEEAPWVEFYAPKSKFQIERDHSIHTASVLFLEISENYTSSIVKDINDLYSKNGLESNYVELVNVADDVNEELVW